jgi:hypothetical protein
MKIFHAGSNLYPAQDQRVGLVVQGLIWLAALALLAGCNFPVELFFSPDSLPPNQVSSTVAPETPTPDQNLVIGPTNTPTTLPCAFTWAEKNLEDETARLQEALKKEGLKDVEGLAVAYGENCVDTLNNKIVSYSILETDFYFTAVVSSTEDRAALGSLAGRLLGVCKQFPPGEVPGPQTGLFGVVFQDGKKEVRIRMKLTDAQKQVDSGLSGAALLDKLSPP